MTLSRFKLNRRPKLKCCAIALLAFASIGVGPATAEPDLGDMTLEQLGKIQVTFMRRPSERLSDAAASIYVISADDILRSGATSLPEALRLAPNLEVARADGNQYAITARGFNSVLANKLLVMIDGRTVYSPLFSGVLWEAQLIRLADVERIEVVSGPGGLLWGTNAVNGVINIITRNARETQGLAASAGKGNEDRSADVRYGGALGGRAHYRVYAQALGREATENSSGASIMDAATGTLGGFRSDWESGRHAITFQGDAYRSDLDQAGGSRRITGVDVIGSWTRQLDHDLSWRFQVYYDRTIRNQPGAIDERLGTFDVEFQDELRPFARHDVLWGGGWRYQPDEVTNRTPAFAFDPADRTLRQANGFLEDDVTLFQALHLIAGAKLEHNDYTGFEFLPGVRLAWKPAAERLLWVAASRAVRAPSRIDRDFYSPAGPPHFVVDGGSGFESEIADVLEGGLRVQPSPSSSFSVTVFHHRNRDLRSVEPAAAGPVFGNGLEGTDTGLEAWGTWRVLAGWRLSTGTLQQKQVRKVSPGAAALGGVQSLGNDPAQTWTFRSSIDLGPRGEFDVMLREVAALPAPAVPRYTAVDARLAWTLVRDLQLAVSGRNLLDEHHPEWGTAPGRPVFERAVFVKLSWAE